MYGIYCTPTLTHAADNGTQTVIGGYFKAATNANGTSKQIGLVIEQHSASTSDTQYGLVIQDGADTADFFSISVGGSGATTLATVDNGVGTSANLTLAPDGAVIIPAQTKLYLDGGGDTYINEGSADLLTFYAGGDIMLQLREQGADGNYAWFRQCCVGFQRIEATFSNSDTGSGDPGVIGVIDSGGTNDTDIDFRHSNKFRLEMTADIVNVNLIFPIISGNFLLVCTTNGDHDVTNWKVYEGDESAATVTDVMWAGGSVPAFTSSGVDIVSFYWDANEQECYGVTSLAFATP
jgi:hypothetical protein